MRLRTHWSDALAAGVDGHHIGRHVDCHVDLHPQGGLGEFIANLMHLGLLELRKSILAVLWHICRLPMGQ